VIVADTSAWIELLRRTSSAVDLAMRDALRDPAQVAVTEIVVMELLAGARSPRHLGDLRALVLTPRLLRLRGLDSYEQAAGLYRRCRAAGESIRRLSDCLVAVPAIEADVPVLHADRDFDVLARHTPLRVVPLDD
jgi:predicted nucleic acid-binding protein